MHCTAVLARGSGVPSTPHPGRRPGRSAGHASASRSRSEASARNVTSRYDGTALIAAANLGHAEVVRVLIRAGAPLDHVNNLGWTALIESIVLGNGGPRHTETLRALVEAAAKRERPGPTGAHAAPPLALARARGYGAMVTLLQAAGGR